MKITMGIAAILFYLAIIVGTIWGWIINLKYVMNLQSVQTVGDMIHIIGIFLPPLGAIMGWFF